MGASGLPGGRPSFESVVYSLAGHNEHQRYGLSNTRFRSRPIVRRKASVMRSLIACAQPTHQSARPERARERPARAWRTAGTNGSEQGAPPGRASPMATNVPPSLKWFPAGGMRAYIPYRSARSPHGSGRSAPSRVAPLSWSCRRASGLSPLTAPFAGRST